MADNVTVSGVGNISTDDVTTLNGGAVAAGSAQTQRVKVQYGDDSIARDVSTSFPLPITGTGVAGTPATGVQTMQGIAGGTAVPVSLATNTPTISAGLNQIGTIGEIRAAQLAVTATAAAATIATLTLPAAGASTFHYITSLTIDLYSTAARTGVATPIVVTSTNLPGTLAWTFSSAGAIGAVDRFVVLLTTPLRCSVANTATTVVGPAVTGGLWRINATYFIAG